MKRFFYSVLAAATMLFATTSCSQDEEIVGGETTAGDTQKVSFTVQLPGEDVESRAIADGVSVGKGNMADKLIWALYEKGKDKCLDYGVGTTSETKEAGEDGNAKHTFTANINMVKGLTYNVLFFAYNEDNVAFQLNDVPESTDLTKLTLKDELFANMEGYDAFVKCQEHTVKDGNAVTEVVLKRPFAQINAATTDYDLERSKKLDANVIKSQLVIKGVPTQLNLLTGEVSEKKDVTFAKNGILYQYENGAVTDKNELLSIKEEGENGTTTETNYNYLNMVYVLAGDGVTTESTHSAIFTFYRDETNTPELVRTIDIVNLPIQRNWRTNVVGNLLTEEESFKIVIDENFEGDVDYDFEEASKVTVTTWSGLQAAVDAANGPTIIELGNDFDANTARSVSDEYKITITQKEGVDLVIDGCGYKFDGTFYLRGNARNNKPETLTFRNIDFVHDGGDLDFISANSTKNNDQYAHNVTVENCKFTGNENGIVVAMRYRQSYNMKVVNCTATNLHSLMQATGCDGITIDGVTATNSEGGVNLNTSRNIVVKNSTLEGTAAYGYGIRMGNSDASDSDLIVKDCTLKADAPILLRGLTEVVDKNGNVQTEKYTLSLEGNNTLTTDKSYQIIICANEYKKDTALQEPTCEYEITGAEGFTMFPVRILHEESGLIWNGVSKAWNQKFYLYSAEDLWKAVNYFDNQSHSNEGNGVTFELEEDIDMAGAEWTPWSVMWITLNGNNHTISNFKVSEGWRTGFFGYLGAAKVNDLTLENVNVTGAQAGILAGSAEGVTTTNVKIAGTNSVSYKKYASDTYTETWGGIGAVTGVLSSSIINAEIVAGAKVNLYYNNINTEAAYKNSYTGYISSNSGTVVDSGKTVLDGTIVNGGVAYTISEEGTKAVFSAVGGDAKTKRYAFGNQDKITSVVVEEGIVTIGDRTFRDMPNINTVTLPNTVTTFEEGAFQSCGIVELTVPENVTYMAKQSIGYLPNIEKIVINAKKVKIGNYIARACPELKSVYINSDSVEFETGSMYFTNKENGDASGITFYVTTKEIAETLYKAMSTSHGYGLKIVSIDGQTEYYNTLK